MVKFQSKVTMTVQKFILNYQYIVENDMEKRILIIDDDSLFLEKLSQEH